MDCRGSGYKMYCYVEGRLGKSRNKCKEYNSSLPLIFGIVECLWRRHCKEVMGIVREFVSIKVPSKYVLSLKETVSP